MRKALLAATVGGFVPQFERNNVKLLQTLGYEVHYASNFKHPWYGKDSHSAEQLGLILQQVDIERSPFCFIQNWKAYRQLKKLLQEQRYDLIHCHTPVCAALVRLAARNLRLRGTRVIYTAHGFHFYRGAPWRNWLLYFPAEYLFAVWTDVIVTINREDYHLAKRLPAARVIKIPGPGLEDIAFEPSGVNTDAFRESHGIPSNAFFVLMVGELDKNKNQEVIIEAAKLLKGKNFFFGVCGKGKQKKRLESKVRRYGLERNFRFFGYCENVKEYIDCADCMVFPSLREGLGMAALEAMARGLPLITSDCRGTREYMIDGITGFLCRDNTPHSYAKILCHMAESEERRKQMGENERKQARKFSIRHTQKIMAGLYLGEKFRGDFFRRNINGVRQKK